MRDRVMDRGASDLGVTLAVWVVLVVATFGSWILGSGGHGRTTALLVLAIAAVKIRLIGRHFMELRHAPPGMQLALDGYLVVTFGLLGGLYLAA